MTLNSSKLLFYKLFQSQSTLERKKKTLSFSRKFPFMKSREDGKSEDGSDQERKCTLASF